jgi:hypothetical protein
VVGHAGGGQYGGKVRQHLCGSRGVGEVWQAGWWGVRFQRCQCTRVGQGRQRWGGELGGTAVASSTQTMLVHTAASTTHRAQVGARLSATPHHVRVGHGALKPIVAVAAVHVSAALAGDGVHLWHVAAVQVRCGGLHQQHKKLQEAMMVPCMACKSR